tara:strand:+ start:534 stop:764 length:231 start_codon:yes stop_codon:yes gene_type:complete
MLRSKSFMGSIEIKYCNCCKKVGEVTEIWFITSAQKRSTDYRHVPLELCEVCAREAIQYLDKLNKYKKLSLKDVKV